MYNRELWIVSTENLAPFLVRGDPGSEVARETDEAEEVGDEDWINFNKKKELKKKQQLRQDIGKKTGR